MKKTIYLIVLVFIVVNCKTENKKAIEEKTTEDLVEIKTKSVFEDELLDVRDVNHELITGYTVEQFGMKKVNDSIHAFVFKLDNNTTEQTVLAYSLGIRGFQEDKNVLEFSPAPFMKTIEQNKYLVLKRKLENIRYFDSIEVYIYERKNWKKSGKLGEYKIKDVVFED